jgi:hypothetical protein
LDPAAGCRACRAASEVHFRGANDRVAAGVAAVELIEIARTVDFDPAAALRRVAKAAKR